MNWENWENKYKKWKRFLSHLLDEEIKDRLIIFFVDGKSGTGKSALSLWLAFVTETMYNGEGFNTSEQVVFTPEEYSEKVQKFINNDYYVLVFDEMRFFAGSREWYSLLNKAITEANVLIRQLKYSKSGHGGVFIFNSQSITDVDKNVRKTIDYYFHLTTKGRGKVYKVYEFYQFGYVEPVFKLKKIRIPALVEGENKILEIDSFTFPMPPKLVWRQFLELSEEAKRKYLSKSFEKIERTLKNEGE